MRQRLIAPAEVFPNAAEIPLVTLAIDDRRLTMTAEIHTGTRVAVPLPGRFPAWSPLSVSVDGDPQSALRRNDGFLWVVLEEGVHTVMVEGIIGDVMEWEWTFQLRPRKVEIEAPGWNFSGVRSDGTPEQQIFFSRQQRTEGPEASYDLQEFQSLAVVERYLELGLVWQVRTTMTRLSPVGKAISLSLPLLEGERVVTANAVVQNGAVQVRLGEQETSFSWQGELTQSDTLKLSTEKSDSWVERWHLVVSPVWNVAFEGIAPTFLVDRTELIPVWNPWPGESVELQLSRPDAIPGETVTINQVQHEVTPGQRQSASALNLSIRASMGEDFVIQLPQEAEITSLRHDQKDLPVRRDGESVIVPLRPGDQSISVAWRSLVPLSGHTTVDPVLLPEASANVTTILQVPEDRWVLWTAGPLRGPAVRFWTIIAGALLAAIVLGRLPGSPLRTSEWALLALGLTQVPLLSSIVVVGWLFFLVWRGGNSCQALRPWIFNLLQVVLALMTLVVLMVFLWIVGAGLLGHPEMFIVGNGSSATMLNWYQAASGPELPQPAFWSISVWWYRALMLLWALWLAASLLRWLQWGWSRFSSGVCWKSKPKEEKKTGPAGS